jgi:hypothetical protein
VPDPITPPTLNDFVLHAQRYGVEAVYETAAPHLGPEDRGRLAMQLRRIDKERHAAEVEGNVRRRIEPVWSLSWDQKRDLIRDLMEERVEDKRIAQMAGVSQSTVRTRRIALQTVEQDPQPA